MLVNGIALFLVISLYLYLLLGGADFGAGIIELFLGNDRKEDQKKVISSAISPVWEANHIWLIVLVVILFNGFPTVFYQISIFLHVPITLLLVGIVFRGCAFTFRHYDAIKDRTQTYYSWMFTTSSFLSSFLLGMIGGGMILGRFPSLSDSYLNTYITPWFSPFSFALGGFVCSLFAFVAAVYLMGETQDKELQDLFRKKAKIANICAIILGALVFVASFVVKPELIIRFMKNPMSVGSMILASLLLIPLWISLGKRRIGVYRNVSRFLMSAQIALILMGWLWIQFPVLFQGKQFSVTLYEAAAPVSTLRPLLGALVVGCLLIFPALGYLLRIFKGNST